MPERDGRRSFRVLRCTSVVVRAARLGLVLLSGLGSGCAPQRPPANVGLQIFKKHTGDFRQGQQGDYLVTVFNENDTPTPGGVVVTEELPPGLRLVSMSGQGWTCPGSEGPDTCDRGDSLPRMESYPSITVKVQVASDAPSPQTNQVSVTGRGLDPSGADDRTDIDDPSGNPLPTLYLTKEHVLGTFAQGQQGQYTLTVSNDSDNGSTRGVVTVTEAPPSGETLISMTGTGWTCPAGSLTCTRNDPLAPGADYPAITVTVLVAADASSPQDNKATVSGGGSASFTVFDTTDIAGSALSISKTHAGNFTQGQQGAQYTATVSNGAGAGTTHGTVTVTELTPPGLTLIRMEGTGWACPSTGTTCTRTDPLGPGSSYPPITVTVNVDGSAPSPVVNQVTVEGGGSPIGSGSDSTVVSLNSPLVGVTVTPPAATAPLGTTAQFTARAQKQDGSSFDVTTQAEWGSSDPSVSVSQGVARGTVITAQPATIQASYGGFTGKASFTATAAALVSISIVPDPATVAVGDTLQLTAVGTFTDTRQGNITTSVFWASSAPNVASVANVSGAQGIVTGLQTAAQAVTITATDEATGIQGAATLTVTGKPRFGSFLQFVTISSDGSALANHGAAVVPIMLDLKGRFVAFESFSTNLLSTRPVNQEYDVYVRDTACIPPGQACAPSRLQSLTAQGAEPSGVNLLAGVSSDATIVAFISGAPNISGTGPELFEITNADPTTLQVQSVDFGNHPLNNTQCGAACQEEAAMSRTGRFVAFLSSDSTLGQGSGLAQAYVHDNCLGVPPAQLPTCIPGPQLISRSGTGQPLNDGVSAEPTERTLTVSADGRFATFFALAPELGNDTGQVVLWVIDLQSQTLTPALASMDPDGFVLSGQGVSMTDDGRFISFVALAPVTNVSTVYRRNLVSGVTTVVAQNATCTGNALSADGEFVAFVSGANPLNLPDLPAGQYAYVAEVATQLVHLVSVDSRGNPVHVLGGGASLSGDGSHIVFSVLNTADNTAQLAIALTGF